MKHQAPSRSLRVAPPARRGDHPGGRALLTLLLALGVTLASLPARAQVAVGVNVNNVVKDFDETLTMGMASNPLRDYLSTTVYNALKNDGVRSLRYGMPAGVFDLSVTNFLQEVRNTGWFLDYAYDANGRPQSWTMSFDQFMQMCANTGAKPVLTVTCETLSYTGTNATKVSREQLINGASNWVYYANVLKNYGVKNWEIGNESDLVGQFGSTNLATNYGAFVRDVAIAMKSVDPTIKIGANGGMRAQPAADQWWDDVLGLCKTNIDFLVTHQYSWYPDYATWLNNPFTVGGNIDITVSARTRNGIPGYPIYITEFGGSTVGVADLTNYVWRALHNVEVGLMALSKQADMAQFWTTRWQDSNARTFWNAFDDNYTNTGMGLSVKAMNDHLLSRMVSSPQLPTANVRTWVTHDPVTKAAAVFLLNKAQSSTTANVTLTNYLGSASNNIWRLKGTAPMDTNVTYASSGSVTLAGNAFSVTLDPLSVTIVRFASLPFAPTNLAATPISSNSINLTWSDTATNETGFLIERAPTAGGAWTPIGSASTNALAFLDTNSLAAATPYFYRVRATNFAGFSDYSGVAGTTTFATLPVLAYYNFGPTNTAGNDNNSAGAANVTVTSLAIGNSGAAFGTLGTDQGYSLNVTTGGSGSPVIATRFVRSYALLTNEAYAVGANDFFQFTVTPANGWFAALSRLSFELAATGGNKPDGLGNLLPGTWTFTWFLRSSADNYATTLGTAVKSSGAGATSSTTPFDVYTIQLTNAAFQNIRSTNPVTFRFYTYGNDNLVGIGDLSIPPQGNTSYNGVNRLDNLTLFGQLNLIPAPPVTPVMQAALSSGNLQLNWSSASSGFQLLESTNLASGIWTPSAATINASGTNYSVTVSNLTDQMFYRLVQ